MIGHTTFNPGREHLAAYLADCKKVNDMAPASIKNIASTLGQYFGWLGERGLAYDAVHEDDIVGDFLPQFGNKGQTKRVKLNRVKGFYQWAKKRGHVATLPIQGQYRIKSDAPRAPRKGLNREEVAAIKSVARKLPARERFIALYSLVRPVRLSELVALKVGDVDLERGEIKIGFDSNHRLKTVGSNRVHTIPKEPELIWSTLEVLVDGKSKTEAVLGVGMNMAMLLVRNIFEAAGIDPNGRGSHSFRHTAIEHMIFELNINPAVVAQIAGNSAKTIYTSYLTGVPQAHLERAMRDAEGL